MTYKQLLEDLLDELDITICWLSPCESDYFNQGVAETMVLESKAEISKDLTAILNKYYKEFSKIEE